MLVQRLFKFRPPRCTCRAHHERGRALLRSMPCSSIPSRAECVVRTSSECPLLDFFTPRSVNAATHHARATITVRPPFRHTSRPRHVRMSCEACAVLFHVVTRTSVEARVDAFARCCPPAFWDAVASPRRHYPTWPAYSPPLILGPPPCPSRPMDAATSLDTRTDTEFRSLNSLASRIAPLTPPPTSSSLADGACTNIVSRAAPFHALGPVRSGPP